MWNPFALLHKVNPNLNRFSNFALNLELETYQIFDKFYEFDEILGHILTWYDPASGF